MGGATFSRNAPRIPPDSMTRATGITMAVSATSVDMNGMPASYKWRTANHSVVALDSPWKKISATGKVLATTRQAAAARLYASACSRACGCDTASRASQRGQ